MRSGEALRGGTLEVCQPPPSWVERPAPGFGCGSGGADVRATGCCGAGGGVGLATGLFPDTAIIGAAMIAAPDGVLGGEAAGGATPKNV